LGIDCAASRHQQLPFYIHGNIAQIVDHDPEGTAAKPSVFDGICTPIPANRDVFIVYKKSYTIIRFKMDNLVFWLFRCHIESHIEAGLVMTFRRGSYSVAAAEFGHTGEYIGSVRCERDSFNGERRRE
jgi:FtsP/CotA-like multicopper oxidase with cupredoxin domain